MKKQPVLTVVVVAAVLIVVVAIVVWKGRQATNIEDITIGALLPLTGDAAVYGKSLRTGAALAVEEINSESGINGKRLDVVYEDTQADPKTAVSAFRKLLTVDRPALVIGDMFSHTTLAVAPVAQDAGVVLLSPTASAQAIPKVGDCIFTIYPSDSYDGKFLAENMPTILPGATNIALVYAQAEAMVTCKDAFVAALKPPSHVVLQEAIPPETRDIRPLLLNVSRAAPDAVLVAAFLPETALCVRMAREQGLDIPFAGVSTCYDPKLFQLAGPAVDGLVFSAPYFDPEQNSPRVANFVSAYQHAYGNPPDVWAAYGYDSVHIAAVALASNTKPLQDALLAMAPFEGVTGRTAFNNDGSVTKDLRILRANASTQSFIPLQRQD